MFGVTPPPPAVFHLLLPQTDAAHMHLVSAFIPVLPRFPAMTRGFHQQLQLSAARSSSAAAAPENLANVGSGAQKEMM